MRLIDIIIPIYGKDHKLVFDNMKELTRLSNEEVGLILVYKNTNKPLFNYDKLKELSSNDVKVIKVNKDAKRTAKVKKGIINSDAKYIMVMDSHHKIQDDEFNKLLRELNSAKNNIDILWHEYKVIDLDLGNKKPIKVWGMGPKRVNTAGKQIFKRESINMDLIDYDIVFYDDSTLGFATSFNKNIKTKTLDIYPYIRV